MQPGWLIVVVLLKTTMGPHVGSLEAERTHDAQVGLLDW
jgi:hypothetical protein